MHPYQKEYTWSNATGSLQSRIDLWLLSSHTMQFVSESAHSYAPFSDHRMVAITFSNPREQKTTIRGHWKLNCNLLNYDPFCDAVELIAGNIFSRNGLSSVQKWEYFKFKVRQAAIRHSKEMKMRNNIKETKLMRDLNDFINKSSLTEEERARISSLKEDVDQLYMNMTKGAFIRSRAKWVENGEKNTCYFFALEKRNYKRNNISSLKIDNSITSDPTEMTKHIFQCYSDLYSSNYNQSEGGKFINSVKGFTPQISDAFKTDCEKPISRAEMLAAINKMKKRKSPGMDGLPVEFYQQFGNIIETPLFEMFQECIDNKEMTVTMKQGMTRLDNWRPITLLNVDFKICSQIFARWLRDGLSEIIHETQTGFMKNRHISSNIRLILDLID